MSTWTLGEVIRPHGVRGGMTFIPKSDFKKNLLQQMLKPGASIERLSKSDNSRQVEILEKVVFGHKIILYFQGLINRNHLEKLLPFTVCIKEETISPWEWPASEWIGFQTYSYQNGSLVGQVTAVENNSRQDILEIKDGKNKFLIPRVPKFVKHIDKEANRMMILVPEWI